MATNFYALQNECNKMSLFSLTYFNSVGPDGSGKSLTLMHILHYCLQKNMVVIHVPNGKFLKFLSIFFEIWYYMILSPCNLS